MSKLPSLLVNQGIPTLRVHCMASPAIGLKSTSENGKHVLSVKYRSYFAVSEPHNLMLAKKIFRLALCFFDKSLNKIQSIAYGNPDIDIKGNDLNDFSDSFKATR